MMSKKTLKEKIGWSTPSPNGEQTLNVNLQSLFQPNNNKRTYPSSVLSQQLPDMPFVHEKKLGRHEQKYDFEKDPSYGRRLFVFDHDINDIMQSTIVVYKNGSGTDYEIVPEKNGIILYGGVGSSDIDLEIRYQYDRACELRVSDVILFPREVGGYSFTDADLHEFMPTADDTFDVDKLLQYGNEGLKPFAGKRLCLEDAGVREEGIVARIRILE